MIIQAMPYPAAAGGGGSPDANTLFLCLFNTSPPVDLVSSANGTLVGNAVCDTANSRLTLDGTGDRCIFPSSSAFDLAGNFTIEVHTDVAAAQVGGILGHSTGVPSPGRWALYCTGSGALQLYCDNVSFSPILNASVMDGSEHHVAICRESNTWRMYKDGVQVSSNTISGTVGSSPDLLFIGDDPGGSNRDVAGHIARVKISDICRYPSGTSFTPPARTDL